MTIYLFWDIDGTLLSTARAGIFALEEATEEVLGVRIDMASLQTAGLTDAEIAVDLCARQGTDDPATAAALLDAYERLLPARLAWREGAVLANVRENLDALRERADVVSMLLTGNVAGGAEAKLRHYGLWEYFGAGGAFATAGCDRAAIAQRARELATTHGGEVPPGERMIVIGDTPHDIACGKAIGARTVAVASGPGYDLAALRACDPDVAVARLPEPAAFAAMLATLAARRHESLRRIS